MDKVTLLEKIKKGGYNQQQLESWVGCLPGSSTNRKPTFNKVGDVYMHPQFQHPYVLLEKRDGFWICGLITSESKCPEILEECRSRFIQGYLTKTIFTASDIQGSFLNNYDNTRHLKKVLVKLREVLK
jgi:hypothetical protein